MGKPAAQQPQQIQRQAVKSQPAAQSAPATSRQQPAAAAQPPSVKPPSASQSKTEQPAAVQPDGAGAKTVTQQEVQQGWSRIKQLVKKRNAMTEGLLNSARSIVLKGDILVLGFQSEVVKSKMETAENIELLRQALQAVLGVPLNVRCTVVGSKSASPADLDVDGDSMVGTALDLGGKIAYEE